MKKILIITVSAISVIILVMFGLRTFTQSHSPRETVSIENKVTLTYCRPYKNDREIFGDLVPYNQVWRTGANKATLFEVQEPIRMGSIALDPGSYSIWTIPGKEEWTIILNSETGQWGVNMNNEANMDESYEVGRVKSKIIPLDDPIEQFTMLFEEEADTGKYSLVLMWDKVLVNVPIELNN